MPFNKFEQIPKCNYTMSYTVTMIHKPDPAGPVVPYDINKDGQVAGSPPLVKIDLV